MSLENFCFVLTYNLLLWRSIVTCNQCNLTLSPLINVWPTLTFCTMSCNRRSIKFLWGEYFETKRPCLSCFCVDVTRILKLAPYYHTQAAHVQFTLGSHLRTRSSIIETRDSILESFENRVSRLEDRDVSDCQLTFERYCISRVSFAQLHLTLYLI